MGLFDKKKPEDYTPPAEQVSTSPPHSRTMPAIPAPPPPEQAYVPAPRAPLPPPPEPDATRYGIQQAIELMRLLPQENVELVVQVVKRTLESARVRIDSIIDDAAARQTEIEGRVGLLQQEIGELEREIATRKAEIAQLQSALRETTLVRDRLALAERLSQAQAARTQNPSVSPRVAGAAATKAEVAQGAAPGAEQAASPWDEVLEESEKADKTDKAERSDKPAPAPAPAERRGFPTSPRTTGTHPARTFPSVPTPKK